MREYLRYLVLKALEPAEGTWKQIERRIGIRVGIKAMISPISALIREGLIEKVEGEDLYRITERGREVLTDTFSTKREVILCLQCLQRRLNSITVWDYPVEDHGTEFDAKIIRATPYRRYWRRGCELCGKEPLIVVKFPFRALEDAEKYRLELLREKRLKASEEDEEG